MARLEEQVEIAASRSVVFRCCHDPERWVEWDVRWVGIELLTSAPLRTGSLIRVDAQHGRRPVFSWEGECVELQFPSGSKLRVIDAAPSSPFGPDTTETWDFVSVGDDTRVTVVWNYTVRGLIARVMDLLVHRHLMRRALQHSLVNLKEMAEEGMGGSSSPRE